MSTIYKDNTSGTFKDSTSNDSSNSSSSIPSQIESTIIEPITKVEDSSVLVEGLLDAILNSFIDLSSILDTKSLISCLLGVFLNNIIINPNIIKGLVPILGKFPVIVLDKVRDFVRYFFKNINSLCKSLYKTLSGNVNNHPAWLNNILNNDNNQYKDNGNNSSDQTSKTSSVGGIGSSADGNDGGDGGDKNQKPKDFLDNDLLLNEIMRLERILDIFRRLLITLHDLIGNNDCTNINYRLLQEEIIDALLGSFTIETGILVSSYNELLILQANILDCIKELKKAMR